MEVDPQPTEDEVVDLTEDSSEPEIPEPDPEILAENKKEEGNTYYKQKLYQQALSCYSDAINLCPKFAAYYGNRAAVYMMLSKYKDALEDARQSVKLDDAFVKGYMREGKCHLALGDTMAAERCYKKVLDLETGNKTAQEDLKSASAVREYENMAETDFTKGDFRRAVFCMDRCIERCPACHRFKIKKAEALTLLGRYQEAQELANDMLQRDSLNADAIYVRGMCLYYNDNVDKAYQHFQKVLRLAPDHSKAKEIYKKAKALNAKKEEGNKEFRAGHLQAAYDLYSEALAIDPFNKFTNSKLYCNRGTCSAKLGKSQQCIDDCTKAVELDDTYLKAYLRRARSYMDMELYEEAVRDYEKVNKLDRTRDRHSHDTPEKQKDEEKIFKEIGEAYSVLSDPKKKERYDSGADIDDLEGGGGFDHIDPNMIFQQFFGGGGNGFSFGGGGGHSHGGGGFPVDLVSNLDKNYHLINSLRSFKNCKDMLTKTVLFKNTCCVCDVF
ncbi:DNAJC7 [Mytilus edulis]|uniref:DNAJC7 n=1 Tax=Mytilus edulis TaxID=6550 RepID=A0A8S3UBN5_MYTED|nr:DNAJC7 [Mytilus edulis]